VKVVFVHDWLNGMRGGEKCLEAALEVFPDAEIRTLLHERGTVSPLIESKLIRTSFLRRLPFGRAAYRLYLPFFPRAVESLPIGPCDLVLSMSHCVAAGARAPEGVPHLVYCFTPMRYAWLFFDEYFGGYPAPLRAAVRAVLARLRGWDRRASGRPARFAAISEHVRARIRAFYGRDADVVYPPVDTEFYTPGARREGDYLLVVSALVPYKRVDLAVRAARLAGERLVVVGDGPLRKRLEREAGPGVAFEGWVSNERLREHYRAAQALLFPGEEDFGIVPVEAQACGTPVVAFARGGALETVAAGRTGVFFEEPAPEAMARAIEACRRTAWDPAAIRANAERFSKRRFQEELKRIAEETVYAAAGAGKP
jgi:glycosyltransferase involved in cell wall biosynthesis